jgi:hypothetical protein
VGTAESELVVRESEDACFGTEVKKYRDRCGAKGFELRPVIIVVAPAYRLSWVVGQVAHIYVYDAGLVKDCFPDEETDFEGKVGEHFEGLLWIVLMMLLLFLICESDVR